LLELSVSELMNVRVTTVSREESTVGKSAAAVSVISQEDIRRSGATTIPELFRMVPGIHVARIDGNKWAISSRGFNSRFAKNLLVQIDGRTLYSPQTAGVFWDGVDYPLEDIDRIEVIRGPGASVWGANAVNGIINIVTKSTRDTQGGLISGGGGTEERGFGTVRYGGKVGDNLYYRVFGKGFDRGKQFSLEGDTNDQWWVQLDWTPNERDTLTLDGGYGRSVTGTKDRFARAIGPPFALNVPEEDTTETAHILARWSRQLSPDSAWKLQVYWDRWQRTDTNHFRDTRFDIYDVDFQHSFALGARQKIVWGLGYRYVNAGLHDSQNDGGFSLEWLDNHPRMEVFSAFVQDEIAIVPDRFSMMLGAKFEHNNFTGFEVQPSGRLLWTPTKRQSIWASVSRAVRTPSFTENEAQFTLPAANPNSPPAVRVVANRALRPEEVWAYELGYRVIPTDSLSVDTSIFYNVHDDLRVNRTNPALAPALPAPLTVASQFDNGMRGETYGVELAVNWRINEWWRLYGSYTFLKMQLHRDADLAASAEVAERQDPQQQFYVQSSWNLPRNIEFDLIGRYVDRLSGFNPGGIPGVSDTVDDYVSLDARLAWHPTGNVEIAIVGQNLLDSHHPELGTNPFIRSPLVEIRRGVFVTASYKW
jgi:iron complex outermembrane receptor protein